MLQSNEITSYIPSKKHKSQCGETGRRDCQALVHEEPCGPHYIRKFQKLRQEGDEGEKKIVNTPNYAPLRGHSVGISKKNTSTHKHHIKNITNAYGRG